MNIGKVKHFIKKHLLLVSLHIALIFTVLCGFALRANHMRMNDLKEQVIDFDHAGDFESMSTSLKQLRRFVSSHAVPNFNEDPATGHLRLFWGTGTFYLQHSYRRAAMAIVREAEYQVEAQIGRNAYAEARDICDQRFDSWSQAYMNCFLSEVDQRLPADFAMPVVVLPDPSLFHLSYASSFLAFDWASLCLLIAVASFVAFFTTLCSSVVHMILDKRRKNP
ncbi:hypothetical protein FWH09_00875 [Candidatus Saccharibacteria bacterium]|nr:hypothetical protein [Candidatus Saccharibacteria bacterium]